MDPRSVPAEETIGDPSAPARQRWRLVLARTADAPALAGRELTDAFEEAMEASGLPMQRPARRSRGRMAFGAPLQLGMAAERELADIQLTEPWPIWRVRAGLSGRLPSGWSLVELFDVWLGAPALAGRVNGAVYRAVLDPAGDSSKAVSRAALEAAATDLLRQRRLPRARLKGGSPVLYDLRPLLGDLRVIESGPPVVVRIETRIHPELGTGRPEEVLAALADRIGCPIGLQSLTRERLMVAGEAS